MANATPYPGHGDHSPSALAKREEHWRRILARHKQSGLPRAVFCRREGIKDSVLAWWTRELAKRDRSRGRGGRRGRPGQKLKRRSAFVPVHVIQARPPSGQPAVEVVTRSGHVVRLPPDFDPGTLRKVLSALEGQPC